MKIVMYHYIRNKSKLFPNYNILEKKDYTNQIKQFSQKGLINSYEELFISSDKFLPTFDDGFKPTALYNVVRDFIFVRNSNALNGAPLVVFGNKLPEPGKFSVNVVTFKVQPDGSPHLFQMCGK